MAYRKIQRKRVKIKDSAKRNIYDKFGTNSSLFTPKKNRVIVESRDVTTGERKVEDDTTNLIVYHGRSWIMQRAFNLNLGAVGDSINPKPWESNDSTAIDQILHTGWKDMYINWFALGTGGAETEDPLEPKTALSVEYELINHLAINPTNVGDHNPTGTSNNLRYEHPDYTDTFGDVNPSKNKGTRDYHEIDDLYPQFLVDQDVVPGLGGTEDPNYEEMEINNEDPIIYNGYKADSYLRALVRVTVAPDEYNGPAYYDPGGGGNSHTNLNEAGLYISPSYDPLQLTSGGATDEVQMFAKVNFSSIRKDETRELIFSWYVYF